MWRFILRCRIARAVQLAVAATLSHTPFITFTLCACAHSCPCACALRLWSRPASRPSRSSWTTGRWCLRRPCRCQTSFRRTDGTLALASCPEQRCSRFPAWGLGWAIAGPAEVAQSFIDVELDQRRRRSRVKGEGLTFAQPFTLPSNCHSSDSSASACEVSLLTCQSEAHQLDSV